MKNLSRAARVMIMAVTVLAYVLLALRIITSGTAGGDPAIRSAAYGVTLGLLCLIAFVLVLERTFFNPHGLPTLSMVEMLNLGVGKISGLTGKAFFSATVRNLSAMLNIDYAFIGGLSDDHQTINTIAVCAGDKLADNFSYGLQGTPCENVVGKKFCFIRKGAQKLFPKDHLIVQMGIESYLGIPLIDSQGNPLGIMVALSKRPLIGSKQAELIFQIFSARVSSELERMNAEKELNAEKDFSDAVFTCASSGIMVLDREGKVLKINPAGAQILGREENGIVGEKITSLFPDAGDMLVIKADPSREITISLTTGQSVPIGFSNSQLLGSSNTEQGIIVSFKNLSETKRLQAENRKKEDLHAMRKVISGVAHEIRNPLFGISSIAQILEREITSPQHQTLIQAMLKEAARMKNLIDELILYTRPSNLNIQDIDVNVLLGELKGLCGAKTGGRGLFVRVPDKLMVRADREKISKVLHNLLENALDAAKTSVTASAGASGDRTVISISDDGQGIRPEDMEKIFDPFFTTKKGGTGLGLPICKKIIEDHGGSIVVKSRAGQGTDVVLTLKG